MSSRRLAQQRRRFWLSDPRCHWCKRRTRLVNLGQHPKSIPHDAATIDHLHSRLDPDRGNGSGRHVLACWKCNNDRGAQEQRERIDIVRAKSGAYPVTHSHSAGAIFLEFVIQKRKKLRSASHWYRGVNSRLVPKKLLQTGPTSPIIGS